MSEDPNDWFDWFGGEGGESGGGGDGGGDFSDFVSNLIFNPITFGIGAIALLIGGVQQCASGSYQATRPGAYAPTQPRGGLPDLPDLPDIPLPDQPTSPRREHSPTGEYTPPPQAYSEAFCVSLVADAKASFGPGWETTIQGPDRDACRLQIMRELQREAVQTRRPPSTAPAAPVDVAPQLLDRAQPKYPPRALERGTEGLVVLEFTVAADGTVKDIVVVSSHPPGLFDSAAIRAVERWRYRPRMVNGSPVESHRMRADIVFRLQR